MRNRLLIPLQNTDKLKSNLAESKVNQVQQFKDIRENMKSITECVLQMTQEMKEMKKVMITHAENTQQGQKPDVQAGLYTDRIEKRFQEVSFTAPKLEKDSKEREEVILKWLTQVCETVFSVGFNLYESGVLNINKTKAYCSENVLRNLLHFSQVNQLTEQEISTINSFLQQDLLPYFCQKYPQSEEADTSAKFSSDLIERDALESNDYDLVYKSKVDFSFQESGNYNSQIMRFLNYIIELPNKMVESSSSEAGKENIKKEKRLNESFFAEMESIFRMVEVENNTLNMSRFNPKKPVEFEWSVDQSSEKEKQEYQQKVKSYTSFQIGQKISENFKPFSESEIEAGDLKLKNSEIMRVVTKWCEQLEMCYDKNSIMRRQTYLRMKDGSKKYMSTENAKFLDFLISGQKSLLIDKIKEEIQKNNHKNQSELVKQNVSKQLIKLSTNEASVGQFASFVFKNNQSYLINYLNSLIHGINEVMQIFIKQYSLTNNSSVPQLITFKIGDLMRCKCSSKEKEIIALYKEIERRHRLPNSDIRIIRVKNRLNRGNKDILMNLLYKGEMVVEMQLAIKSDKSKFIQCSYNFNHYLYELKRAQFGPIMEMCNVWISKDLKAKFYLDKMEKLNKRLKPKDADEKAKLEEKIEKCCTKNQKIIQLPFRCSICKCFYSSSREVENNIECQKCEAFTCEMCQLEISDEQRSKLMKKLDKKDEKKLKSVQFMTKLQGRGGVVLNLKSKKRKLLNFIISEHKEEFYMFEYNNKKNTVHLIEKLKSTKLPESFLKENLVFTSPSITKQIEIEYSKAQIALNSFLVKTYLKEAYKTEKNSIALLNQNITSQSFQIQKINSWPNVRSINFSECSSLKIQKIEQKFPNVESAILNEIYPDLTKLNLWGDLKLLQTINNGLQNLDFLVNCNKIVELNASYNQISSLPKNSNNFQKLQKLELKCCYIKQFSKEFCSLPNLQQLELSQNSIKQLPQQFSQMVSLHRLRIQQNQLTSLPNSFRTLKNLQQLHLSKNKLTNFPQQICPLQSLKYLNLSSNKLQNLPDSFTQLINLVTLKLNQNKLNSLPNQFGKLCRLQALELNENVLKNLPESFGNLRQLKQLGIQKNQLEFLHQNFQNLESLESLWLTANSIQKLPESFGNLQSLTLLSLSQNNLTSLPESFQNLSNLSQLYITENKLTQLPDNFGNLRELTTLYLSKNQLQNLPASFRNMGLLKNVRLLGNRFGGIPKQVGQLENLEYLEFFDNRISDIDMAFLQHPKLRTLKLSIIADLNLPHDQSPHEQPHQSETIPTKFPQPQPQPQPQPHISKSNLKIQIRYLQEYKLQVEELSKILEKKKNISLTKFCTNETFKFGLSKK